MLEYLAPLVTSGLQSVLLFGVPERVSKSETGEVGQTDDNPVMEAVRNIRAQYPGLTIACDVCLCPYTSHGHCGLLHQGINLLIIAHHQSAANIFRAKLHWMKVILSRMCSSVQLHTTHASQLLRLTVIFK